jgi:SRSO17 transposase
LLDSALAAGARKHVMLADAGYGDFTEFREALTARELRYVVGINGEIAVWPPGSSPRFPRLLCQWPDGEPAPTKSRLSTRPATAA